MVEKKSPMAIRSKKRMVFIEEKTNFRAVTEEVDGQNVRKIRGYAILFDTPGKPYRGSRWVEKVDRKALKDVDFSRLVLLLDHNTAFVFGRVGKNMTAVVDDTGLFIDCTLGSTWLDDYVYDRVHSEIIDGMSFWFDNQAMVATDWENKVDVILKINEVYEVSIVVFPAYEETVVVAEEQLEDPFPENNKDDEAKKLALLNLISQL